MKTWEDIPGYFDYQILYDQVVSHLPCDPSPANPSLLVECGVYYGRSLCYLGQRVKSSGKNFHVIGIDNLSENFVCGRSVLDAILDCGLTHTVSLLVCDSVRAASFFADNSASMVFLDTIHDYEQVRDEIVAWLPKVKRGGIIAGDDVGIPNEEYPVHPGVRRAVNELLPGWLHSPHDSWVFFKR